MVLHQEYGPLVQYLNRDLDIVKCLDNILQRFFKLSIRFIGGVIIRIDLDYKTFFSQYGKTQMCVSIRGH